MKILNTLLYMAATSPVRVVCKCGSAMWVTRASQWSQVRGFVGEHLLHGISMWSVPKESKGTQPVTRKA
jgi:hypothetical protein